MQYSYPFNNTDDSTKRQVWQKGVIIEGYNANVWRRDIYGFAMKFEEHGNTNSQYGWEIDHIKPKAKGGETTWDNLQPLQWENNRKKGDNYPWNPRGF